MMGKRYTTDETTLCTYAALYDVKDFGGYAAIATVTGRESRLFHDKVRNIVAMLDELDIPRNKSIPPLTGTTTGQPARKTDLNIIQPLTQDSREVLFEKCRAILKLDVR